MASPSQESKKAEAKKKGAIAAAAGVATAVAFVVAPPVVGIAGIAATGLLGYRWVRYRIKEGLRF
jgi:hypothetical protein